MIRGLGMGFTRYIRSSHLLPSMNNLHPLISHDRASVSNAVLEKMFSTPNVLPLD